MGGNYNTGADKGETRRKRSLDENIQEPLDDEMLDSIKALRSQIDEIRRPRGESQGNPARTCKDLKMCKRASKDGKNKYPWLQTKTKKPTKK